jgi:poly(A) polymerase
LLVRYAKDKRGRTVQQAVIYTPDEHEVSNSLIDPDAIRITSRLQGAGHHAYIVGGAVRDMLVGNVPKDFDIATDAQPNRIRRLFRNSRVIGKRFRLVHVFFGAKNMEVSTFRSENSAGFQNEYGDLEEDVYRRDFSLNALYYNPADGRIIDYVGGVKDIRDKRVRNVIPLDRIFVEDPVRMIRAIKYSVSTGFSLVGRLKRQLKRSSDLLADTSNSRMTEEVFKILVSGHAAPIFRECISYKLFPHMLPRLNEVISSDPGLRERMLGRLAEFDAEVREAGEDRRSRGIAYLCGDYLFERSESGQQERISFTDAFAEIKQLISPLVPANKDVEMALVYLIRHRKVYRKDGRFEATPASERVREDDVREPQRPVKKKRRRSRRPRKPSSS